MDIQAAFDDYTERMADLHLHQRAAFSLAQNALSSLAAAEVACNANAELDSTSWDRMYFFEVQHRERQFFGLGHRTLSQRMIDVQLSQNKQYQWLFTESYELYEDFLELAYCHACADDNSLWPKTHSVDMPTRAPLQWFIDGLGNVRNKPKSILHAFRNGIPGILAIEKHNALEVDLRVMIPFLELLRHIIVHNGGLTKNKELFFDKVWANSGISRSGQSEMQNYMESFFGQGEYANQIWLLESLVEGSRLGLRINRFEELVRYLMGHAHLIVQKVQLNPP